MPGKNIPSLGDLPSSKTSTNHNGAMHFASLLPLPPASTSGEEKQETSPPHRLSGWAARPRPKSPNLPLDALDAVRVQLDPVDVEVAPQGGLAVGGNSRTPNVTIEASFELLTIETVRVPDSTNFPAHVYGFSQPKHAGQMIH